MIKLKIWAFTQQEQLKKTKERQGKLKINDQDKMKENFLPFGYM